MKQLFAFAICLFALLIAISPSLKAGDSAHIYVHFLYGSRPAAKYKGVEKKWFGGMIGGHVGVGVDSNTILNFCHHSSFHIISNNHNKHSHFMCCSPGKFCGILGGDSSQMKTLTICIPVSKEQLQKLDSLKTAYLKSPPYDYALFGMRCGAASYDILACLGIVPKYSNSVTALKIFYPKKLRTRLVKLAETNGWAVTRQEGTERRVWEKD
jgi:hypothetical protein